MAVIAAAVSNDELRARLIHALGAAEYATTEALDGLEALRVAFEQQPDAMVIDVAIDEVDGLELVRMLRTASDIPIIAITPEGNPELSVQLLDLGADDVATYAAPSSEIVARVRATVRRAQRRTPSRPTDTVLVQTGRPGNRPRSQGRDEVRRTGVADAHRISAAGRSCGARGSDGTAPLPPEHRVGRRVRR